MAKYSKKKASKKTVAKKSTTKDRKRVARPTEETAPTTQELDVKFTPRGPDQTTIETFSRRVIEHASVQALLKRTRNRLLSFDLIEPEGETKSSRIQPAPNRFRATFYDYTNNRTVVAEGSLDNLRSLEVSDYGTQPLPTSEEFDEAVGLLRKHPELGRAIRDKRLQPYPPMPPLIATELPDGRTERTVAVGLLPIGQEPSDPRAARHEIVGVNMIRQSVSRFDDRAPANSAAHNPICGQPNAGQPTAAKGTAGQVWVTVSQGGTVLWKFLAVRPAASSGTNGSGIELRYLDYRGKRVLYRAHVPILNVKYDNNACGPYRDWQYQEGMIQANGANVGSGFRLCPAPAQTILDTGSDVGNFLGVAIYVQGLEVVLVSEMQAGWYRYISEWRLHADGTIRPRFGFSAVQSSCVCNRHHHHAYWRLDFDIRTPGNNVAKEFNDPPLFPPSNWHTKYYEIQRSRNPASKRKWRVENSVTGEGYEIIPGPDDGRATAEPDWPFPRGDVWFLRYHGSEIDDGVVAIGPPYEAGIDGFVNGESIVNQDIVVWYGAHFTHDIAAEPPGTFGEIVGPILKPVNW